MRDEGVPRAEGGRQRVREGWGVAVLVIDLGDIRIKGAPPLFRPSVVGFA